MTTPVYAPVMSSSPSEFATPAIHESSWEPWGGKNWWCKKCGRPLQHRVRRDELVIEWYVDKYEQGSTEIADWNDVGGIMVTDRVKRFLDAGGYTGYQILPVRMVQDPKLKKPKRITSRTKKRIWLPYEGPPLHEVRVTSKIYVNLELNQVDVSRHLVCSACEHWKTLYLRPPESNRLRFKNANCEETDFFRIIWGEEHDNDDNTFWGISSRLKQAIEIMGFNSIDFQHIADFE